MIDDSRGTHNPLVVGSIPTEPTKPLSRTYAQRRTGSDNRAACQAYLAWLSAQGRKPLTVYQYGGKLEALCVELGPRWVGDVDLGFMERFVARPRGRYREAVQPSETGSTPVSARGKAGSAATRSRDVTLLRGFYRWARTHAVIATDPSADLQGPLVRNSNPKAIPDHVWCQVWHSVLLSDSERVVLGLGYFGGLRRSEICNLEVAHVDLGAGRLINFPRKGDANDRATGVVPLASCVTLFHERAPAVLGTPENFFEPLKRLVSAHGVHSKWLVGWGEEALPWRRSSARPGPPQGMTNPDQLNRRVERLLVKVGLPPHTFTPHALRHSFVTQLVQMGIPLHVVSRLANHSSPTVTMRYVRTAADPLAEFLSKPNDVAQKRLGGQRWDLFSDRGK